MHNFKELKIWQKSVQLATEIYKATQLFPKTEQYGLVQQIRRSIVSVSSNIAEGSGRKSNKEFQYFLNIAYGSLCELDTQLVISKNLDYLQENLFEELQQQVIELQKMVYVLIRNIETVNLNTQV